MAREPWSQQNYVGIKLFAGAPNPRWVREPAFFAELRTQLVRLPATHLPPSHLSPNSWYGGVVVHLARDTNGRRRFILHDGYVFDSASEVVRLDRGRRLEMMLFATMPAEIIRSLDRMTFAELAVPLNEKRRVIGATPGEPKPQCAGAPTFAIAPPPVSWDQFPGIDDNNCYNYANNEFSVIDDAQPGRVPWEPHTEEEMHNLLLSDGLMSVGTGRRSLPAVCSTTAGAHLIAVCLRTPSGTKAENGSTVNLFKDYHCFRLDQFSTGPRWTHKDGANPSTDDDNSGTDLADLATGNFKVEHVLVGYYWSVPGVRNIGLPVFP